MSGWATFISYTNRERVLINLDEAKTVWPLPSVPGVVIIDDSYVYADINVLEGMIQARDCTDQAPAE